MEFRPCIDIHNGKVKQIIGSSLREEGQVAENFVSEQNSVFYANLYKKYGIKGGHVIVLNKENSPEYEASRKQAFSALSAYQGGLQVGGGIHPGNAEEYLEAGASHVIVTSYVFCNGNIDYEHLKKMKETVGKERLVLDLSCRRKEDSYMIVTDRWQKETKVALTLELLDEFAEYCDEFLIHAVDVEGKAEGIEEPLAARLGQWEGIPVTYAGGVHQFSDLKKLKELGRGKINVTIGSALDLFGGPLRLREVLECVKTPL